jgi:hypothetical protein
MAWVQRAEFIQKYPANLDGAQFVDSLIQNVMQFSSVDLSNKRQSLIDDWNVNHDRARVVRSIADDPQFSQAEYNRAFVLMQHFGYLRRNPDQNGYNFCLNILIANQPTSAGWSVLS